MSDLSTTESRILQDLSRFAAGDVAVVDKLIDYAANRLQQLARSMLRQFPGVRRWEQTDDILQNALLRLLRALKDVKPQSVRDFLALATLQIRRELLDLARRYYGPEGAGTHHASWPGARSGAKVIEESDLRFEPSRLAEWREFHEHVQDLPGELREAVSLLYYQGLTQVEAATLLNVNVRTVQRRWQSALLALHRKMKDQRSADNA